MSRRCISRVIGAFPNDHVLEQFEAVFDINLSAIRVGDGVTPGGVVITASQNITFEAFDRLVAALSTGWNQSRTVWCRAGIPFDREGEASRTLLSAGEVVQTAGSVIRVGDGKTVGGLLFGVEK